MRKTLRTLLICGMSLSLSIPASTLGHAQDVPPLYVLQDCAVTPDVECIEKIEVTDTNGVSKFATRTGRTWKGDESSGPNGTYRNTTYYEYQVDGLTFEEPAGNRFVPRIFYFPFGNNPCEFANRTCPATEEFIQVVMEASWFSGASGYLPLKYRSTNRYCGAAANPTPCQRNLNFNQELTFKVTLHMPTGFKSAYITGRSKDLTISSGIPYKTSNGAELDRITLEFTTLMVQRMLFTPLLPNPFETSDYADFESDQALVNIYSTKSSQGVQLGKCASVPSISVSSNSANVSLPQWDQLNQSISINLQNSHFKVDGSVNTGFFQAAISREIGKCLWGIDLSAQTKAEISITENNGTDVQRVEVITGSFSNGTYILSHSNFHYSAPKISIKIRSEEKLSEAATLQPALPQAQVPIKKKITCVKSKKRLIVTAVNPQCPSGYKKVN